MASTTSGGRLRRCNADKLTPDALQALTRHKSYLTTQVYINLARQIDAVVEKLYVPDVSKVGGK